MGDIFFLPDIAERHQGDSAQLSDGKPDAFVVDLDDYRDPVVMDMPRYSEVPYMPKLSLVGSRVDRIPEADKLQADDSTTPAYIEQLAIARRALMHVVLVDQPKV